MKRLLSLALAASALVAATPGFAEELANQVMNGRYQAILGDCSGCHTVSGGKYLAGGEALVTPFGKLVPPNITPDKATGIGNWSYQDFRNAMTRGVGHDGKHLYPAMPYPNYSMIPDRDLKDLWTYLKTVTPVDRKVVANQLPFPFNQRVVMRGWNMINFTPKTFKADPDKSPEWNRGAYIVQGPGHCSACHSPKTLLGADKSSGAYTGAELQGWYAPNITGAKRRGIGDWSEDQIVRYLKTGTDGKTTASGPMAEAVTNSTSKMTDADLKSIAVYIKSLPASEPAAPKPLAADDARMTAGAAIYRDNCSACHGAGGEGAKNLFPALKGDAVLMQDSVAVPARAVLFGSKGAQTAAAPTRPGMPALGWRLNDTQVADVLSYVRNSWGNAGAPVAASDVATVRKQGR
ncbi:c-type cytochrome [Acidimangrovimonas sediminis]|uniref:c-type cytochrome n=1 Tax=Acidimangrovimonas sediminis TaxID=2056283 RepID=UPI000C800FEE|nr:c-type cytochrome [Acidimangrovimonas sediminis]